MYINVINVLKLETVQSIIDNKFPFWNYYSLVYKQYMNYRLSNSRYWTFLQHELNFDWTTGNFISRIVQKFGDILSR